MKPYMNLKGKGLWAFFWGDKVPKRLKRIFKKSQRNLNKKIIKDNTEG